MALTDDERVALPEHPAGLITLYDEELAKVQGGRGGKFTHPAKACIIKCA